MVDRELTSELLVEADDETASGSGTPLACKLGELQAELGHGHPKVLALEEQLAREYLAQGDSARARSGFEEVLIYRAVLDGEHGIPTALVACDLLRLLWTQGDRSGMAEIYYRYLSWIPMRDPGTLDPKLSAILADVEGILAEGC